MHSTYSISTHTYLQNEAKRARSMISFTRHVRMCRHGVYLSDILRCRTPTSLSSMDVIKQEHATLANQSTLSTIRQPLLPFPLHLAIVIATDSFPTFPPLLPSLRHVPIIHPRRRDLQRLCAHTHISLCPQISVPLFPLNPPPQPHTHPALPLAGLTNRPRKETTRTEEKRKEKPKREKKKPPEDVQ